jgi:hypothetical protein
MKEKKEVRRITSPHGSGIIKNPTLEREGKKSQEQRF